MTVRVFFFGLTWSFHGRCIHDHEFLSVCMKKHCLFNYLECLLFLFAADSKNLDETQ
jgi:hypothetical protein